MINVSEIVLASASARRKEILTHLGLNPRILVSEADENVDRPLTPEMLTEELSLRKAGAVLPFVSDGQLVIASDTVVAKDNLIFGKPHSESEAFEMLSKLSGTTHKVVSGVAVSLNGRTSVTHDVTNVTFRRLTDREIESYVASGEPFDKTSGRIWNTDRPRYYWEGKAGGYGIQDPFGMKYITRIEGDYYNVVGLPVSKMCQMLKDEFGIIL